jgi:hypothetical protein
MLSKKLFIPKNKKRIEGKKVTEHINHGEAQNFNERATCKSRDIWYHLQHRQVWTILYPMIHHDRQVVVLNKSKAQVDHNLFEIKPKKRRNTLPLCCFLLSTLGMLIKEFSGRVNLGEGALKTEGIDIKKLLVPLDFSKKEYESIKKLANRYKNASIESIFSDLNAEYADQVSLDKVRPERRELDKIIMGDILGLNDDEQLEVYKAVIDLVRSRIDKAKSLENDTIIDGINVDVLNGSIVKVIDTED